MIGNSLQPRPYGILVNLIDIDFSKLLGAYVGVFALVSVLSGRLVFRDQVPASTWAGLAVILGGPALLEFEHAREVIADRSGHLDPPGDAVRLHTAGGVHRVAPRVVD